MNTFLWLSFKTLKLIVPKVIICLFFYRDNTSVLYISCILTHSRYMLGAYWKNSDALNSEVLYIGCKTMVLNNPIDSAINDV